MDTMFNITLHQVSSVTGGSIVQPVVGGKPMQFTGKPLTTAKGLLQLGGKGGQPLSVIQTTQGQISTLSLIPQALTATSTASGHVVTSNSGKLSVTAVACKYVFHLLFLQSCSLFLLQTAL